ncbi:MAG TPA: radical SAM/SPASM domain-containing protein [Myxococcales bacterium]|jgi:radical SAM protein with 4Fe4S-binding SPASM domain
MRLSKYVRLFRVGERCFAESVLDERGVELDAPALELARILAEEGPIPPRLASRLPMLLDLGMAVFSPEADEEKLAAAHGEPAPEPIIDQLELTNRCPMSCAMCPKGNGRDDRPLGQMDAGLFREILGQVSAAQKQWKPLALYFEGESLLHPDLDAFVRLAAQAGVRPELSINPALLPLDRYRALEEAGIFRLVLSLDGLDAATLEGIRGRGARAQQAVANVEAILEHRARSRTASPALVLQMLRLKANAHQQAEFLARFANTGLPGVLGYLKPLDANTPAHLFAEGERPRPMLCSAPWKTLVVLWDGRVVPCCHDPKAEWVLGDLRRQSLAEVWRSEQAQRLRLRLRTGWPSPEGPCGRCAHRPDEWERPSLDAIPEEPLHW